MAEMPGKLLSLKYLGKFLDYQCILKAPHLLWDDYCLGRKIIS